MDFNCAGAGRRRAPKASPERVVPRSPSDPETTTRRRAPKAAHDITAVANFIADYGPAVPFHAKHLNVTGASFALRVRKWELVAAGRGFRVHAPHDEEKGCGGVTVSHYVHMTLEKTELLP